jgi:hypothetical protein
MKTTNYYNSFITIAEDCPASMAEIPPIKNDLKSIACLQFEMVSNDPYRYTSDDVIFGVYAVRNKIPHSRLNEEREHFFSKGQACLRSSPLTKRYGWGVHSNADGKIAIYPVESEDYRKLADDPGLSHYKAMRSKRFKS